MIKIAVDAGHGSNTAGKRTPPLPQDVVIDGKLIIKKGQQFREHIANVGVAVLLTEELKRCGFEVFKSGWNDDNAYDDADTPLADRQKAIKAVKCDYSISIHFNAFGDGNSFNSAEGIGIYIHDKNFKDSEKFANTVLKHLTQGSKQKNRGVTKQALAMCNCSALCVKAAILPELAFMTNEREAVELMGSKAFWQECAEEIARGVCEYTGVKYIPKEQEIPKTTIKPTSSKEDIKWLQSKLNTVLPKIEGYTPLKVDGDYGPKTRIAVLMYWEQLGWGKTLKDDGTKAGSSTIKALADGRKK